MLYSALPPKDHRRSAVDAARAHSMYANQTFRRTPDWTRVIGPIGTGTVKLLAYDDGNSISGR